MDHEKLLKELEVESALALMEIDMKYETQRAKMVAKYGEEKIAKFEMSVKDGDGISYCVRKSMRGGL